MYDDYQMRAGETDYLAKAAEQLDRAAKNNERLGDRIDVRERIARQYAVLGAIQRGVLPQEMAKELFDSVAGSAR